MTTVHDDHVATDHTAPAAPSLARPAYDAPFIDVKEWRTDPVPHHYMSGGFRDTDARFSFYFPPLKQYRGRFFHNTYLMVTGSDIGPFPIRFDVAAGNLGFTIDSGAYYVQTNMGGADRAPPGDPAIAAYLVNAAAAQFSRTVAAELYGPHRPFGYLFGGSAGSFQVMGAAEVTQGVWDGFLPFAMGNHVTVPSIFTIRMHALRTLRKRGRLAGVWDAVAPGGSGDPYAGLDDDEAAALREVVAMGFPLGALWEHETINSGNYAHVAPAIPVMDPNYAQDFWSKPGYLGGDPDSDIHEARFAFDSEIAAIVDGTSRQLQLSAAPDHDLVDAHLTVLSGAAAGKSVPIAYHDDRTIGFVPGADHATINMIAAGDRVRIDNDWGLALQTYARHHVVPDMHGMAQYRDQDGNIGYPQREALVGPMFVQMASGSDLTGHIHGKMLLVGALLDVDSFAWHCDWYRQRVASALGADFDDNFALWLVDHAQHDNPHSVAARAHTVAYDGVLQQGLCDLARWVETGLRPNDSRYTVANAQTSLPATAAERGGPQPIVSLLANGQERADIAVNDEVSFTASIETPQDGGYIIAADWDFTGVGDFPVSAAIVPQPKLTLQASHVFTAPGTYFPVIRVIAQREGSTTPFRRIENIARVRVVVR